MSSLPSNKKPSRLFLPVAAVILLALVAVSVLKHRGASDSKQIPNDGLTYLQRVTPLVNESAPIAAELQSTNTFSAALEAGAKLRDRWQDVRTGPGYDRKTHDGFILTFGGFFDAMKSAEMIQSALNHLDATGEVPKERRMEVLFVLQSIHDAETGAVLVSKTGLSTEALLSRTNLVREFNIAIDKAVDLEKRAARLLDQLKAGQ